MKRRILSLVVVVVLLAGCYRKDPVEIFSNNDIIKIEMVDWNECHIINDKSIIKKISEIFCDVSFIESSSDDYPVVNHQMTVFHQDDTVESVSLANDKILVSSQMGSYTYECSDSDLRRIDKKLWDVFISTK